MYLLNYALYDLYALFICLRSHPQELARYRDGVQEIIRLIESPEDAAADANCIRRLLRPCYDGEELFMSFVAVDNVYTADIRILKNKTHAPLLAAMLRELLAHGDDADRVSCLCDSLHNVPLMLANEVRPKRRIRSEVELYRKRYNPDFVKEELKRFR